MITWNKTEVDSLISLIQIAGRELIRIRQQGFEINKKSDHSPVTTADLTADQILSAGLSALYPKIPVVSEERIADTTFSGSSFFLIDPLDGTREFIDGYPHFTVNVGYIVNGKPVLGLVYAPALEELYLGWLGFGSFRIYSNGLWVRLTPDRYLCKDRLRIMVSRSHHQSLLSQWITQLSQKGISAEWIHMGSSLKICHVAAGYADAVLRPGPASEWDTAAAHAVLRSMGMAMFNPITFQEIVYGSGQWIIPGYIACSPDNLSYFSK